MELWLWVISDLKIVALLFSDSFPQTSIMMNFSLSQYLGSFHIKMVLRSDVSTQSLNRVGT